MEYLILARAACVHCHVTKCPLLTAFFLLLLLLSSPCITFLPVRASASWHSGDHLRMIEPTTIVNLLSANHLADVADHIPDSTHPPQPRQ